MKGTFCAITLSLLNIGFASTVFADAPKNSETAPGDPDADTITAVAENRTALAVNTYSPSQAQSNYKTLGVNFNILEDYGSFGDSNTHFGFVVNGGKSRSTGQTTGSWQLMSLRYTGFAGSTASSFITAGQALVRPTLSHYNNTGQWTGWNAECIADAGTKPVSCVAEEADIQTSVQPTNIRQGLRIVDIGSVSGTLGAVTDSGMGILKGDAALGFRNGLLFGDEQQDASFPIVTGGTLIKSAPSNVKLAAFIDFSSIAAPPDVALSLPANIHEMCFGAAGVCGGGELVSSASENGGKVIFSNSRIDFAWGTAAATVSKSGTLTASSRVAAPLIKLTPQTFGALPACEPETAGSLAYITDASNAITAWHQQVTAGGGHNTAFLTCNGKGWFAFDY